MTYLAPSRGEAERLAPWGMGPGRLWSLWDMLTFKAAEVLQLINLFYSTEMALRNKQGPFKEDMERDLVGNGAREIARVCSELGLPLTAKTALAMMPLKTTVQGLHAAIVQTMNTFHLEMESRTYFGPLPDYQSYYDNPKIYGDDVFDRFPSARDDLYEAGACLALERSTACVMHLMKVLEAGLAVLAAAVGVAHQNDWGAYIRNIDNEVIATMKGAKARSGDEQFYSEAAANFDYLRRAYRNPTMHPDRSYSQARAAEIMVAIKSFMIHLATKLREREPSSP